MVKYNSFRKYTRRIAPYVGVGLLGVLLGSSNMDTSVLAPSTPPDIHLKNQLVQTLEESEKYSEKGDHTKAVSRFGLVYYILSEQHRFSSLPQLRISTKHKSEIEDMAIKTYQNVILALVKKSQEALEKGDYGSIDFFNLNEMRNLPYPVNPTLEEQIRKLEILKSNVKRRIEKPKVALTRAAA